MSSEENPTNERESSKNPLCRDKLQWILSIVNACSWEVVIKIIDALYLLWEIDRGSWTKRASILLSVVGILSGFHLEKSTSDPHRNRYRRKTMKALICTCMLEILNKNACFYVNYCEVTHKHGLIFYAMDHKFCERTKQMFILKK